MKFNELREANLSKAQINKVHDKADDLPKSDFIKRYGKEGDAVRFATATNIVKKQLGIGEGRIMGISRLNPSYKEGEKAAEKGIKYDKNPYSQSTPGFKRLNWSSGHNAFRAAQLSKAGKPNYGARGQFEELDKEDEKSIGDVIKGLKKAVKSHQGQVKSLTKDIQDEVSNEGGPGSGPQHGEITITKNGKSKKVKRPALSIFKKAGWKQEEVELDEVHFSNRGETPAPKGMHKLRSGRDIPSSPQVDKIHKKVVKMTDRNDHFGAKIEIAKACGDKKLVQIYNALELMHDKYGVVGNKSIELRQIFEPVLNNAIDRKFGKYADVIRDAT